MIVYLAAIRTPLGLWPASLAKCNSGVFPVGIHRTAVALVVMKPSYARQCERQQLGESGRTVWGIGVLEQGYRECASRRNSVPRADRSSAVPMSASGGRQTIIRW